MYTTTIKDNRTANQILKSFLSRFKARQKIAYPLTQEERTKLEAKIRAKLEAGKRLSSEEMEYLKKYNPALYAIAFRVEMKRKNVENRLKNATSKEEVEQIQAEALGTIKKDDVAKQYLVAAIQDAVKEFKESKEYKNLPQTAKEAKKKTGQKAYHSEILYELKEGNYQMAFQNAENAESFTATS